MPNYELNACKAIKPTYLDWQSAWVFVPSIFAFCGLIATSFVVTVFLRNNDTPVVINYYFKIFFVGYGIWPGIMLLYAFWHFTLLFCHLYFGIIKIKIKT